MKATVVTDSNGAIVASAIPVKGHGDAPTDIKAIVKDKEQHVHQIDIPDELAKPEAAGKLHGEYKVEGVGDKAKLVKQE